MDQELREVLEGIKQDIAGIKQDVAGNKRDIAGIKQDIAEFRAETAAGFVAVKEAVLTLARMVVPVSQVREVESKLRKIS